MASCARRPIVDPLAHIRHEADLAEIWNSGLTQNFKVSIVPRSIRHLTVTSVHIAVPARCVGDSKPQPFTANKHVLIVAGQRTAAIAKETVGTDVDGSFSA